MRLVSADEMREMDRRTIEHIGIPQASLMENAGKAVAEEALTFTANSWIVLAGKGNNGGDGLVCARHLVEAGKKVLIVFVGNPDSLQDSVRRQKQIIDKLDIPVHVYPEQSVPWSEYDGVIDALLGTGTANAPREPIASLIREANASKRPILSVDIPSGIHADTGEVYDPCIRAQVTVALALVKKGMVQYPAAELCGDIRRARIGIPEALAAMYPPCYYVTPAYIRRRAPAWFSERAADTHKGTYGHVLVAGGSLAYSGAGLLAVQAALRAGCGLASWYVPAAMHASLIGRFPEAMLHAAEDQGKGGWDFCPPESIGELAADKQALVIGPGMGRFASDHEWIARVLSPLTCPTVVDADALNMIAATGNGEKLWQQTQAEVIITPHPGEMARLCDTSITDIQRDRITYAADYASRHGVTVVLKGARTVIAAADGATFINSTGNAAMATGGAGDVLAGLTGGLLAQGWPPTEAAVLGVYLHGEAGDKAAAIRANPDSLIASDLIDAL